MILEGSFFEKNQEKGIIRHQKTLINGRKCFLCMMISLGKFCNFDQNFFL